MNELMNNLFCWDQDFFLQSVFLSLDTTSLKTCRNVCTEWKQFIDARVWGCLRYKPTIIRNLWRDFDPKVRTLSLVREQRDYITSVCCDDSFIFCGYSNGICKLFSLESGALVSVIEDTSPDIQYSHCKVYMGSDIFVRIAFGYSAFKNEGRCDIGIWSKVNKKKLFRTIHRNRNMCFFLRVIDNTIIVREGRFFCQITILEDCSIKYKALHNLEKLMRGDFLANSDYIVSKHGDSLMFLQLTPNYDLCQVPVNMKIIDICLHNNNIFLLHENSVSYYNLETKTLKENVVVLSSKPVSMEVNHHVVAVLDTFHDIFLFNMSEILSTTSKLPIEGQCVKLKISSSTRTSYPKIILTQTALVAYSFICDTLFLYSLWEK